MKHRKRALSPRVPVKLSSTGQPAYTDTRAPDPTAGRHGDTTGAKGRRKRNTMRSVKMGGAAIHRWEPEELAREALASPAQGGNGYPQPRHKYDRSLTRADNGTAAASEGFRQSSMARRSVLITNGAVDVVPRTGPVWSGR